MLFLLNSDTRSLFFLLNKKKLTSWGIKKNASLSDTPGTELILLQRYNYLNTVDPDIPGLSGKREKAR